jgi:hypothetical protein
MECVLGTKLEYFKLLFIMMYCIGNKVKVMGLIRIILEKVPIILLKYNQSLDNL